MVLLLEWYQSDLHLHVLFEVERQDHGVQEVVLHAFFFEGVEVFFEQEEDLGDAELALLGKRSAP